MLEMIDRATVDRIDQLSVEFHDFLDPGQRPAVTRCIQRLHDLGFTTVKFSHGNGDVLFVNRHRVPLSALQRMWLLARYRYPRGVTRAVRRAAGHENWDAGGTQH